MNKLISTRDIVELAREYRIDPAALKAVVIVECGNSGFDRQTGKIKIQFEPHVFRRYSGITIPNTVDIQSREWQAYKEAYSINPEWAMLSTSWGMGQIMGFNHKAAGYATVQAMVSEFELSEFFQLRAMLRFIQANPAMYTALRRLDWEGFARRYNGPNYKKFNYDTRLESAYQKALKTTKHD